MKNSLSGREWLGTRWLQWGITSVIFFALLVPPVSLKKADALTLVPPPPTQLIWTADRKGQLAIIDTGGNMAGKIITKPVPRSFLRKARGSDRRLKTYIKSVVGASFTAGGAEIVNAIRFKPDGSVEKLIGSDGTSLKFKTGKKRGKAKATGLISGTKVKTQFRPGSYSKWVKRANKLLSKGGGRQKSKSAKARGVGKKLVKVGGRVIQYGFKAAGIFLAAATVAAGTAAGSTAIVVLGGIGLTAGMLDLVISGWSDAFGRPVSFTFVNSAGNGPAYLGVLADLLSTGLRSAGTYVGGVAAILDKITAATTAYFGTEPEDFRVIDNSTLRFSGGPQPHTTNWVTPIGLNQYVIGIAWDMLSIPDSINVFVNNSPAGGVPAGLTSGTGYTQVVIGDFQTVRIVINTAGNPNSSTAWNYSLRMVVQ